jgi:hypothetical protein
MVQFFHTTFSEELCSEVHKNDASESKNLKTLYVSYHQNNEDSFWNCSAVFCAREHWFRLQSCQFTYTIDF